MAKQLSPNLVTAASRRWTVLTLLRKPSSSRWDVESTVTVVSISGNQRATRLGQEE